MKNITSELLFFIYLAKAQAISSRHFDGRLGGGIGLNDFIILYHLSEAEGQKLRRIDLAEKIGLTASGVTRLLAPMEKIGLIKREASKDDLRVSYVALAPGGKRILMEQMEKAELLAEEAFSSAGMKPGKDLLQTLSKLGK